MAKEKKKIELKDVDSKVNELKIELLKNPTKRKGIKREIARLLTVKNANKLSKRNLGKMDKK